MPERKALKASKVPSRKHISYLITGIIGGLVLGYVLFDNQKALAPIGNPSNNAHKTSNAKQANIPLINISVDTQIPGNVILVKKIVMDKAGWIAVHDDQNGQPGRILGANFLSAGTYQNQMISLLRGIADEGSYFVVIHDDNGDRSFDFKLDLPRKDPSEQTELVNFKVVAESPRGD